ADAELAAGGNEPLGELAVERGARIDEGVALAVRLPVLGHIRLGGEFGHALVQRAAVERRDLQIAIGSPGGPGADADAAGEVGSGVVGEIDEHAVVEPDAEPRAFAADLDPIPLALVDLAVDRRADDV